MKAMIRPYRLERLRPDLQRDQGLTEDRVFTDCSSALHFAARYDTTADTELCRWKVRLQYNQDRFAVLLAALLQFSSLCCKCVPENIA